VSTTYLGLTLQGPGVAKGEPGHYFPTGQRNFVRLVPADDVQAAAAALYVKGKGASRAFVLNDRQNGDGAAPVPVRAVARKRQ